MATQDNTFANRGDAIPVIHFDAEKLASADAVVDALIGEPATGGKVRPRAASHGDEAKLRGGFQERMFGLLLQQVLPTQDAPVDASKPESRSKQTVVIDKPNFSLPIMSSNFRRFNARIGVVFVFQKKVARILSWKVPTHTLSLLTVYTFCCLSPNLVTILPLVTCLFFIMEPAFVARHPPPVTSSFLELHAGAGPATAPPVSVKPIPEMSKDFFRNMRDLQNSMEDFSVAHDGVVQLVASRTNFSDERLSSLIYQSLFASALFLLIAANLIPWRALALVMGWAVIVAGHPEVAKLISAIDKKPLKDAYLVVKRRLVQWMNEDILLDEKSEKREVEIFELQRRHDGRKWEAWLFSALPYDQQSPARIAGDRPKGAVLFEDVQPPKGWEWSTKKWDLDLQSQQWVEDRMITSVDVESDGERWVYDAATGGGISASSVRDFDEGITWRRRRWKRTVRRKIADSGKDSKTEVDSNR